MALLVDWVVVEMKAWMEVDRLVLGNRSQVLLVEDTNCFLEPMLTSHCRQL